ncbi:unnamed protein product [Gongylonema pulchrum]|uniref:NEDD8-activating enzyme E1 catalytic subunit n=1 Tax=Gongylonema pulchrum TaxID=637853 RepID=A0A183E137_9BILA|nr:unnamed protein product [Gongylonema pulchrum]
MAVSVDKFRNEKWRGLGCELLKDLALSGFQKLEVIDMDTIELSNLNRQFLFRENDVGKSKAEVAAAFINKRISECNVSLVDFDADGNPSGIIPLIDGGTEGFKGNSRVILPTMTACIECTIDLYPPQVNFPMCTIANTPRLPEHCIEYVKVLQWPADKPFNGAALDTDNPEHVEWVLQAALERASKYRISGVDLRLTRGVLKRIIPAVASTNAIIAGIYTVSDVFLAVLICVVDRYSVAKDKIVLRLRVEGLIPLLGT